MDIKRLIDPVRQLLLSITTTLQPLHQSGQLLHIIKAPACPPALLYKQLCVACMATSFLEASAEKLIGKAQYCSPATQVHAAVSYHGSPILSHHAPSERSSCCLYRYLTTSSCSAGMRQKLSSLASTPTDKSAHSPRDRQYYDKSLGRQRYAHNVLLTQCGSQAWQKALLQAQQTGL